jgi:hypothetical protein
MAEDPDIPKHLFQTNCLKGFKIKNHGGELGRISQTVN